MSVSIPSINAERPWFRQPLVWMMIAIPLSSVLVGMVMLTVSIVSFDGMVADDYYKQGLQINRVLDRQQAASLAQLSGTLTLRDADTSLLLESAWDGLRFADQVQVNLSYATSAGKDVAFTMTRASGGSGREYLGPSLLLPRGRWYVHVSADATEHMSGWRLSGTLATPAEGVVTMSPGN
jgi:hypothetical protein